VEASSIWETVLTHRKNLAPYPEKGAFGP
jgi:hypothetical protein